jgi:hypothetical protein
MFILLKKPLPIGIFSRRVFKLVLLKKIMIRKMNEKIAELLGMHAGDGTLYKTKSNL